MGVYNMSRAKSQIQEPFKLKSVFRVAGLSYGLDECQSATEQTGIQQMGTEQEANLEIFLALPSVSTVTVICLWTYVESVCVCV